MRADPHDAGRSGLIVGCLSRAPEIVPGVRDELAARFGPVALDWGPEPFAFTSYYAREMGEGLWRWFFAFSRPFDAAALAETKRTTIALEAEFARRHAAGLGVSRPVNLDPGYVTAAKLVLATTKDFAHRVYLRDGIFAEVTLHYRDGGFRPHDWTYPDYRSPGYLAFFEEARKRFMAGPRGA